ncbi:AmmeMemoRadiSam system radical SAM enzyme [Anaerosphaera multitolerans]|uniref:AmmeMemoRadiSam system radical SAM enzyme n=1 Tax=Anaerosphaera multitolerans TaxID=2487351 RepID=A0A437S7V0_9FIRM|nr:AmmeMemoRadiSam system radical SAM enzyme [Anaerosphaera multitolerans]RVU55011.1 AmmeMemoRadiSam system radical SAM enzyme [Anaerosphaera multitolerans]
MSVVCKICPRHCTLKEGQVGFCKARMAKGSEVISLNYGQVVSLGLDPIEKKPLYHFMPGSKILSVGSFGCNFRCDFCQNYQISMSDGSDLVKKYMSPRELVDLAEDLKNRGNIGIAYTYNEPLIGYEYVLDTSKEAHSRGLKNVLVTNGYIEKEPFLELLPYIDAVNIDLKSFNEEFYKSVGGDLKVVMESIKLAAGYAHVEVTTLIIEGINDDEGEMDSLARWLCTINPSIPLHISRFFPAYKMMDRSPTSVSTVYNLIDVAKTHLNYVYPGNC